jgi:hypothetical protein
VFLEGVILWIHKIHNISYSWWMKMHIYSNLNAMLQFQSMTYQKVWKPFVVYLYSFLVDVFVSILISLLIYENDLDHIIYDDTTNYTIQINHKLDYSPKII